MMKPFLPDSWEPVTVASFEVPPVIVPLQPSAMEVARVRAANFLLEGECFRAVLGEG